MVSRPVAAEGDLLSGTGLSNSRLGMMLLVGTETVLFTSFIGAFLVLRFGATSWPPEGTPALDPVFAWFNTSLLLGLSAHFATLQSWLKRARQARKGWISFGFGSLSHDLWLQREGSLLKTLQISFVSGVLFIGLQVFEFYRVYEQGLTLRSGTYGALFYSLVTCHALHVLGGLVFLGCLISKGSSLLATPEGGDSIGDVALYWHFVTAVWIVLFGILYLWK